MKKPKFPTKGGDPSVKVYKSGGAPVKRPDVIETKGGATLPMKPLYSRPKKKEQILQHNGVLIAKKGDKQGRPIALTESKTMASLPKRKQKWAAQDNARAIGLAFANQGGDNTQPTTSPSKKKEFSDLSPSEQKEVMWARAYEKKRAEARVADSTMKAKKSISKAIASSKGRKK